MTSPSRRFSLAFKALRQLGLRPVGAYAWYQLELRSGLLRWRTPLSTADSASAAPKAILQPILSGLPDQGALASTLTDAGCQCLLLEAEEVLAGQVRLFGGPPVPLRLELPGPQKHWSARQPVPEGFQPPGEPLDIKWVWEPARFAWVITLARAWLVTADERFPAAFWRYTEAFLQANPANLGANWASAQEVALRLMSFCLVWQVFSASPETTPERTSRLSQAIAEHAARIPPTLAYARAQNNNHLLAEAASLYTAAVFLPGHPSAPRWRALGWKWFNLGLQSQIAEDGAYTQNSASYQRLALQLGLFVNRLSHSAGHVLPPASLNALARLTQWLLSLVDGSSGQVPNLGPNDGAYFLPIAARPYQDYRPTLQAASRAFSAKPAFAPGEWDEMTLWLAYLPDSAPTSAGDNFQPGETTSHLQASLALDASPHVLRPDGGDAWAYLRVARFTSRPGHADQLHFDLWWRGVNLARDAGTYLYNAPSPWNNSLARTAVHNTVTLHGQDQMTWAGRFLWLDWAQGQVLSRESAADGSLEQITAYHDGYRRAGVIHQRSVEARRVSWIVEDLLLPARSESSTGLPPGESLEIEASLNWLLPDWPCSLRPEEPSALQLASPYGPVSLLLDVRCPGNVNSAPLLQVIRAAELVLGSGEVSPTWGWYSPTYGYKEPALSVRLTVAATLPLTLITTFLLPEPLAASHA